MSVFDRIRERVGVQENFDATKAIEDVKRWREEDEAKQYEHFSKQIQDAKLKKAVDRSGVLPLHQGCTVENYQVTNRGQAEARDFTRSYIDRFELNNGQGFVFAGEPGTGKNHLAAAMCNELIDRGKSCLVITVNELMIRLRNCYSDGSETSEDKFYRAMIAYDLLIIDEVGLQRGTTAENITINTIVDQRLCRLKPTGMLTNCDANTLNDILGIRVMDRMRMNQGQWMQFDWESYRK
ncbi:putative AAA family ATPase [Vibrio phage vB_VpP_1]|nr:putative AAA family ATPase [Vibrio phage vB_VpP_1]